MLSSNKLHFIKVMCTIGPVFSIACNGPEIQLHSNMAKQRYESAEYDLAIWHASRALDSVRSDDMLALRGRARLESGRYYSALSDIDELMRSTQDSGLFVYMGDAMFGLKNFESAIEFYSKAINHDSRLILAYRGRAKAYSEVGQPEMAIKDFLSFIEKYGADYDALNSLGLRYREIGDLNESVKCFSRCIDLDSTVWIAHYNLSTSLFGLGDTNGALSANSTALLYTQEFVPLLLRERGKILFNPITPEKSCSLWRQAETGGDKEASRLILTHCVYR